MGSTNAGWYVYDPLTNGGVVFPHKLYQDAVIGTFDLVPEKQRKHEYKFKVTSEVAADFSKRWPSIQRELVELAESRLPGEMDVLMDYTNIGPMAKEGYQPEQVDGAIKAALKTIKGIIAHNRITE